MFTHSLHVLCCQFFLLESSVALPPASSVSPLNATEFQRQLVSQPDQEHVVYMVQGILKDFRQGFQSSPRLGSSKQNKPPDSPDSWFTRFSLGRADRPFPFPPQLHLHIIIGSIEVTPKRIAWQVELHGSMCLSLGLPMSTIVLIPRPQLFEEWLALSTG